MAARDITINIRPDRQTGAFIQSYKNGSALQLSAFYREEKVALNLYFVAPAPTGGLSAPLTLQNLAAYSCRVGIGVTDGTILCLESLTWDTDHFEGVLNINTTEMNEALDESNGAEITRTFEVELKNGSEEFTFQQSVTIRNEVLTSAAGVPEDLTEAAFADRLQARFEDSDTVDVERTGDEFQWHVRRKEDGGIGADADGIFIENLNLFRDATLSGPLRVETPPTTPHGNTTSNTTYSTAVTVGGITGRMYQLDFRVRGLFGLTTYSGGVNFGLINIGGTHSHPTGNPISITVSDPPQTVFLNQGASAGNRDARDFRLSVTARAGATITLLHDTTDNGLDNWAGEILVPGVAPYPAEFDGWFIQLDIEQQIARQTGKETIWIPSSAMTKRTTDGPADASSEMAFEKVMVTGLDFEADTPQFSQFNVAMPKSWNEGAVTAEFLWTAASGTGSVRWGVQAVAIGDADALDAAFGTAQEVTDELGSVNALCKTAETSAITVAGTSAAGNLVVFQVYRAADNAADTLDAAATLLGVRLFYNTDAVNDN